jgi:hypoxanthine-guanine phosphoribosyltransferase
MSTNQINLLAQSHAENASTMIETARELLDRGQQHTPTILALLNGATHHVSELQNALSASTTGGQL